MTIIYAIIIFLMLIFLHEFGHFAAAKLCGVKVNEFALGMGPAIFKRQKGETLYALRILPIGGYCAMEGEDEESDNPRAFGNRPAWQRACVLIAGPFMNFLTCVVLLIIIACWAGQPTTTIGQVQSGSPADKAGIKAGDTILAVDGSSIDEWEDILTYIGDSDSKSVDITLERDGSRLVAVTEPEYDETAQRYIIGITTKSKHNILTGVVDGVKNTGTMTVMMYSAIKQLFTGELSMSDMSGPVGVVYVTNQAAKSGVIYVVYIAALLSLNLAIVNMLPFPALDGGRVLFLIIRLFTGKRVSDETEGKFHFVGIMLLFALMIYITVNDVLKYVIPVFM